MAGSARTGGRGRRLRCQRGRVRSRLSARRSAFSAAARVRCEGPGADDNAAALLDFGSRSAPASPLEANGCTLRLGALESVRSSGTAELNF